MSHVPPRHIHRAPRPTLPGVTASSGSMRLQKVSSQPLPFSTLRFDHLFSQTPFQWKAHKARHGLGLEVSLEPRIKAQLGKFYFNPVHKPWISVFPHVGRGPGNNTTLAIPDLNIHLAFLRHPSHTSPPLCTWLPPYSF